MRKFFNIFKIQFLNFGFAFLGTYLGIAFYIGFRDLAFVNTSEISNNYIKSYKDNKNGKLLGIGEFKNGVWYEYFTFKKKSRLHDREGDSALVINNIKEPKKTFELGFYNYGPTLATDHEIVEFFIGNSSAGAEYSALSIRQLNGPFGGSLQIRNHADTSAIFLNNFEQNSTDFHAILKPLDQEHQNKQTKTTLKKYLLDSNLEVE